MNYGYGENQTNFNKQENIPSGSRLVQYLQAGNAASNSTQNATSSSFQSFANSSANMTDSVAPISYPFSQMNISARNADIEDGVSAFLNSNYASNQDYYQNANTDEFLMENEDSEDAYYVYQGQPPRVWKNRLKSQPRSAFFIDPNLKSELISRQLALQATAISPNPLCPSIIDNFHNVMQLSTKVAPTIAPVVGRCVPDTVYRAVKSTDGHTYCLRRISTPRPLTQKQLMSCESWKRICHTNVVQFREIVSTRVFNDYSYFFVYDFYSLAQPLKTYYFGRGAADNYSILPRFLVSGQKYGGLAELLIWSYIIQLSSAIRFIHSSGLAIRFFDISRILICGKSKLLLSSCGIGDFLFVEGAKANIVAQQVEDLRSFGHILLILAVGKLNAAHPENIISSMQHVEQNYSIDFKNLIQLLCGAKMTNHNLTTINDIMPMIGARFYGHIESMQLRNDYLEEELSKEVENGRLYRILCKLNTVNERLDPNLDVMWSETGDRYFLKLFRDYVFHQINANGKPWIDLSHISMCLNKLDAGVNENIQLASRDGDNMLIVSFAELRRCLDSSFNTLIVPQFSLPAPMTAVMNSTVGGMAPMVNLANSSEDLGKSTGTVFMRGHGLPLTDEAMRSASMQMAMHASFPNAAPFVPQKTAKRTLAIEEDNAGKKLDSNFQKSA